MSDIGVRCHELRIRDRDKIWRIIYRIDDDAIVIAEMYHKTTQETPRPVIDNCRNRLRRYDGDAA
jgi:phage-related protein